MRCSAVVAGMGKKKKTELRRGETLLRSRRILGGSRPAARRDEEDPGPAALGWRLRLRCVSALRGMWFAAQVEGREGGGGMVRSIRDLGCPPPFFFFKFSVSGPLDGRQGKARQGMARRRGEGKYSVGSDSGATVSYLAS